MILRHKPRIRGQAVVEYILISAMIVGVVAGVMFPVIRDQMRNVQTNLEDKTTTVIRQDVLGIPLSWFQAGITGADIDDKIDGASGNFRPTSTGSNSGANPLGSQSPTGTTPSGNDQPNTDGAPGSSADSANNNQNGTGTDVGAANTTGGRKSGGDQKTEETSEQGTQTTFDDRRNQAASAQDTSENGTLSQKNREATTDAAGVEGEAESEGVDAKRARVALSQQEERRGGGCGGMNIYTLLKLAIAIAIFLLAAAVIVTTKGQKGQD